MRCIGILTLSALTACSTGYSESKLVWESLRSSKDSQLRISLYRDTDADGVRDFWDQCRQTLPQVPVNTLGCPLDRDGDGRPDYQELDVGVDARTPKPPASTQSLPKQLFAVQVLGGFGYDLSRFNGAILKKLDEIAVQANRDSDITELEIIGHTDSRGDPAYNQALSLRRARVVENYLRPKLRRDVRVSALGKGELSPRASNDTEAGRAANRRVEIRTIYQHH